MTEMLATPLFEGGFSVGQGLAGAGMGLSAISSIAGGNQAAAADSANAQIEKQKAQAALATSEAQATQVQQQTNQKMGEIAADYGASGVEMKGSPLNVMMSNAIQGQLSKQLTLYQGSVNANYDQNQAQLDQNKAAQDQSSGWLKGGTTLLTGFGALGYNNYKAPTGTSVMTKLKNLF